MENKNELEKRFQFLLTIALFFPVLLEPLFREGGKSEGEIDKMILYWGLQVAILIVAYILLELTKKWQYEIIPQLTNIFLLLNLASFAVVIFIFAGMQNSGHLPYFYKYIFLTTFPAILVIPSIILLFVMINLLVPSIKRMLSR